MRKKKENKQPFSGKKKEREKEREPEREREMGN